MCRKAPALLPTWNDLELHAVDLHFHVGTARPEGNSMLDVVSYAVATGRRVICMTDHWWKFTRVPVKPQPHYPGTMEGYRQFAADAKEVRAQFPDTCLLFGPEIGFGSFKSEELAKAFEEPGVDMFLGEPGGAPEGMRYGDYLIAGVEAIATCRQRFSRPGILVHPIRSAIKRVCGSTGPGPLHPKHPQFPPLSAISNPLAHVEEMLDVDIHALADTCVRLDVPVEINMLDFASILAHNHQSFAERYLFSYRTLIDNGVQVVLGSDWHNLTAGEPTAFLPAMLLGVKPRDMRFLEQWLGPRPG
jgi:hypothetical protein